MCASWPALAVAFAAAVVLDLALLSSLVWTELLAADVRRALWLALAAAWAGSALWSVAWHRRRCRRSHGESAGNAFDEALRYYLEGDWFRAERTFGRLLRANPRDADSRLMLATLLRHTGRLEEAARQLAQLEQFEDAEKWAVEIHRERELLAQAETTDSQVEGEPPIEGAEPGAEAPSDRQSQTNQEASTREPPDPPAETMHAA